MNPQENTEKLIRKLVLHGNKAADERIVNDAMAAYEKQKSAAGGSNIWRTIMRSRITKLAAAAVIIIAVMIGINQFGGSIDPASVAWADVVENMKKMPWVHATVDINYSGQSMTKESWKCFEPSIDIMEEPDGVIRYYDFSKSVMYVYKPDTNTITISSKTDEYNLLGPESPVEIISSIIERAREQNAEISTEQTQQDGLSVEIIRIVSNIQDVTLVRDIERNLVIAMQTEAAIPDSDKKVSAYATIDYPDDGPRDIYALGVSKDAIVIDTRPKGSVKDITDEVQRRFDAGIGDHVAVILHSRVEENETLEPAEITIMRQKGKLKRLDHYRAFNAAKRKDGIKSLYEDIKDDWPNISLERILELEHNEMVERQMLFDGKYTFVRNRYSDPVFKQKTPTDFFKLNPDAALAGIIWLNPQVITFGRTSEEKVIESLPEDTERPGLCGFRVHTTTSSKKYDEGNEPVPGIDDYWFDPDKDYMFVERINQKEIGEHGGFPHLHVIVKQTARTPDGKWYPAVISKESVYITTKGERQIRKQEKHILLDVEPTFEPDIFDSSSLMK
ncbi:MAG: hypothetical protein ACYS1A_07440 [Planctomycetota bacterium]|jgi:hypothetical protein